MMNNNGFCMNTGRADGDIPEICPLSMSQLGVYMDCVDSPESVRYNIPVLCRLPESVDCDRFADAVKTVASHHKALFVTVSSVDGVPSMIYHGGEPTVSVKTADSIDEEAKSFRRPFDLTSGPLYRFEILKTPEGNAFLFDIHHIIFDGSSLNIMLAQIRDVYNGGECPYEEMTLFDAAYDESLPKDEERIKEYKKLFDEKLDGTDFDSKPVPDAVADDGRAGIAVYSVMAGERLCESVIDRFVKANGITKNSLFLGAFGFALSKFNGTSGSYFTTAHTGRYDRRLASTVGMFVKTLPFTCRISEDMSPLDVCTAAYEDYYRIKQNDVFSFGDLAAQYGIGMDVSFIYQSTLLDDVTIGDGKLTIEILDSDNSVADFEVMLLERERGYEVRIHYNMAHYSEGLVMSFADMYIEAVCGMIGKNALGEIELVSDGAREKLDGFNKTETDYDTRTVVEQFREQAKKTPDNICLVYEDKRYTYREVDEITDRLAKYLVRCGVGREKVVGVLIPRCEYMLICSLGVLKAGGAYLPLDPSYPPERLNLMVADSGAVILFHAPELDGIITSAFEGKRICVDVIPAIEDCGEELPAPSPDDLFVMLYTSGSTGVPKGVMMTHSNITVTTEFVKKYYDMDESSRVTAYASYGFDAHAYDMYPAITSGAQLHIISDEIRLDFPALVRYFNENGITHTVMTMQVGRQFALMGGLTTLKHLSVAGEKLIPLDKPEGFRFYNLYGPTEGSIITSAFYLDRKYNDVPIGRAVENLKTYIVDKEGKLLPVGAVGELWISGPHVTRGYLNRPEKTAEAYGENTFDKVPGYERIYRTGDIVRMMPDGNLQFIGRRDAQVKVRGFRVELTEVEEIIRRFSGIKDATVAAFDDPAGGKFIAAYVVSDDEIDTRALGDFIRSEKPPYMVPAVTMRIDKIPLNQNQKVNRKALPVPVRHADDVTPPENEVQQKIFDTVSEVVGHTAFGVDTDIYEVGLTSIGAVRLNVSLGKAFETPLKISDIKENPTVRQLERFFSQSEKAEEYEILPDYPITETQRGIFVEWLSDRDSVNYNMPLLLKLGDNVDTARFVRSAEVALDAHPYLKTILFTDTDGDIRAKRNDDIVIRVPIEKEKPAELVRPFVLLGEPLYRVAVYETERGKYFFLDIHHIISDGASENVILSDIDRAYIGEAVEREKYTGYEAALDEEKARKTERYNRAKEYYKSVFAGVDPECLPGKCPESTAPAPASVKRGLRTDFGLTGKYCEANGVTANAFWNSVIGFVLSRFTHRDDAVFTTVYNGRSDSRLSSSVTMLVKTIPVYVKINGDETAVKLISDTQKQLIGSMSNDLFSFAEISAEYGIKSDFIFVYQGESFGFDSLCGEKIENIDVLPPVAKAPVTVNLFVRDGRYEIDVDYRKDIFCHDFIESFIDSVDTAAESFISCDRLKDVTMLSERGEKIYSEMNAGETPIEDVPAYVLFEREATKNPDKCAVVAAGESLSFRELNERANTAAHALIALGVGRDEIVGLVLDRTVDVPVCEIALQKSGGAFLPMIPTYPDDRIDYCLTNAGSRFVITTEKIKAEKPELFADTKPYKTLTVESLLAGVEKGNPNVDVSPDSLVYCIYTSGSTGTPKGVMLEHRNFSNFVQTDILPLNYYSEEHGGSAMSVSSISFDMSLYEMYLTLCTGRTLVIATDEEFHNPLLLRKLMLDNNVQMMTCTPSFMNNVVSIPEFSSAVANLVSLTVGAEAFPSALYSNLRNIAPELQIVNGYGPTETSICCSTKELHSGSGITIGRPTGNVKFYVVDSFGNILPPYASGELMICGAGVGRGYVRLPEKTAASFFELRGIPAYHSGDLVRVNRDAEIEFSGRLDNQVKLRGFRVELDEIEKVMCAFGSVKQAKVIVRTNGTEDYLAGFFTASEKIDMTELTSFMKERLTYYMIPSVMMQLDALPLTPNGKIDKKALPETTETKKRSGRRAAKKSLEQRLCEIFSSVLSLDTVYADDNFFENGGTSLSASKVTMMLMSEGIDVKYGDIFDNPTPEELAAFIEERDGGKKNAKIIEETEKTDTTRDALKYNSVKYAADVKREPLGNVLLTGAVGFLGIHVLRELLKTEEGHIYCLVRRGEYDSPLIRLKTMLIYYFSDPFEDAVRDRVTLIDADITDTSLKDTLRDVPFDTIINCAACVKHFSDSNILEEINVNGVKNLISIAEERHSRIIQISTVSIPGIHTEDSYAKQVKMHENELFVIDDMDNKYAASKYHAELAMFDAIERGVRGKVIRVGNLMGRHSDGEFQANMETNMFISGIRGFAVMGKYPISHMTDPMRFSPVDCTARAVVLLAGVDDRFTAFNCDNRYGFDEMKVIDACNRNGITIVPEQDEIYYKEFKEKLGDDRLNAKLGGLAAYDIRDAHAVDTDNLFTTNILYRIGFSWPLVDDAYLDRAINSIMTLDYFDITELDDREE